MATMNVSLTDALRSFVEVQVAERGFGTTSEYLRELLRREQDRVRLRGLLLEGISSPASEPVGKAYFSALRGKVRRGGARAAR